MLAPRALRAAWHAQQRTWQYTYSFLPRGTLAIRLRRLLTGRLSAPGTKPFCSAGGASHRQMKAAWAAASVQQACPGGVAGGLASRQAGQARVQAPAGHRMQPGSTCPLQLCRLADIYERGVGSAGNRLPILIGLQG